MELPITLHVPDLRPNDNSLRGMFNYLVENISAQAETILESNLELPTTLRVNNIVIDAQPSVSRNQTFQDKDGTISLLEDAYGLRPAVVLPEGLITIDWDAGSDFLIFLSRSRESAIYMAHSQAGMEINITLVNNGIDQTIGDWDSDIIWEGGTAPTVPAAAAGASAFQRVNLVNVNGTIYGEATDYSGPPFLI